MRLNSSYRQTNNVAEIRAAIVACQIVKKSGLFFLFYEMIETQWCLTEICDTFQDIGVFPFTQIQSLC